MILPILITENWVSVVKIDENDNTIAKSALYKIPPAVNKFESFLTKKQLEDLFESKNPFNEFQEMLDSKKIIATTNLPNIDVDLPIEDISGEFMQPIIIPEKYYPKALEKLSGNEFNLISNYLQYKVDLPLELRVLLDSIAINLYLDENRGSLVDVDGFVVIAPGIPDDKKIDYIRGVVAQIAENIPISGMWDIHFDTKMEFIPYLFGLVQSNPEFEPNKFFAENPLEAHNKLIIAPGVSKIELEGEDLSKTIELKESSINVLKLGPEKSINIKWKSKNSKFDGEVFGTISGIKVDNRERGGKQ